MACYNNNYIKLFRKITSWEWYDDPKTKDVFLHLLITATYKERDWHGIHLKRGQTLVSQRQLTKTLGLSLAKIRTAFKHLESTGEIITQPSHRGTLVTICNYGIYQGEVSEWEIPASDRTMENVEKPQTQEYPHPVREMTQQEWLEQFKALGEKYRTADNVYGSKKYR